MIWFVFVPFAGGITGRQRIGRDVKNRLSKELSPYLLQHCDNPVDWFPWGEEAFALAQKKKKPIFVSIGYAACHWCHVMAHESFEDPVVAKRMNDLFVNIKVDREEMPDVDQVFMNAIQVMGENGGWPLSAFCTPQGEPYFVGTYFPRTRKYGRPSFIDLLQAMSKAYAEQPKDVAHNARGIREGLQEMDARSSGSGESKLTTETLVAAGRFLVQGSDKVHGGLGGAPKFPSPSAQALLGRTARLAFGEPSRTAFLLQARKMALGGIYDHLGGGFARYSVDDKWLVPHFEKMLYDNAQLLSIYGDAFTMTGDAMFRQVICETTDWLKREMSDTAGGLYASLDADSEGEEGTFYVWTPSQIREALGFVGSVQFCDAFGVTDNGNFENNTTVLSRVTHFGAESDEAALTDMRKTLLAHRENRQRPPADTKVLAGWNGLAITGLLQAWRATGHTECLSLAKRVGQFLLTVMHKDGKLARIYKDGVSKLDGTLEDYAFVARGFIDLACATEEQTYWDAALALLQRIEHEFMAEGSANTVFYMTATSSDSLLVHRPISHVDGATPSGGAVALECFLRVGQLCSDTQKIDLVTNYLSSRLSSIEQNIFGSAHFLSVLDQLLNGRVVKVTSGDGRQQLIDTIHRSFAPGLLLTPPWIHNDSFPASTETTAAQAYVCQNQTCLPPTSNPTELEKLIRGRSPH